MKKQILIIFLILLFMAGLPSCGKKDSKEKTYPEHLIDALDKAGSLSRDHQIQAVKDALNSYYIDNGDYPGNLNELVPTYLKVETQLIDSWGTTFQIENTTIVSAGKDKEFGTADDRRWEI
ncbi:MAG: type II secretion system protein GspG [Candidatus Aminicenantes bacterium]|nr:type II secretion system protein GspG [Candidatus Aminicenantes bacterium]